MPHQAAEIEAARAAPARAQFWDAGTGKSLPVLAQAADLSARGQVRGTLVLAPRGVHSNWIDHEARKHLDPACFGGRTLAWSTERSGSKEHRERAQYLLDSDQPSLVAMSYDSAMTEAGTLFLQRYLKSRPCLLACDESHRVKTPGAKRTKRVVAMSRHAPYRRVLTGTPTDNSPFDAYSQLLVLDPRAWHDLGCGTFSAFKAYFGVWEQGHASGGRQFQQLKSYRNLDRLREVMARYGSRVRLEEVIDLPPRTASRVYHEMAPAQRRAYDSLRTQLFATLDDGSEVTCALRVVLLTRLRQVAAGYVPGDDDRRLRLLADPNPRIAALLSAIEDHEGQALVWCVRDQDVDLVLAALRGQGMTAVQYDGRTSDADRETALGLFRSGKSRFFVGKPAAGGIGIDLVQARTVFNYSYDFNLTDRKQSEARARRKGQEHPVTVVDVVAERSVDEYVLKKLSEKNRVSADLLGDPDVALI